MIVVNSNSFDYNLDSYGDKIIALVNNKSEIMKTIYNDFNFISNTSDLLKLEKNNLVSSTFLIDLLIEGKKIPFDTIIINLVRGKDLYYQLIINLMKYSQIKEKDLIIYNHYENLPFYIKDVQEEKNKKEIKINFYDEVFKIKERKEMIEIIGDKISQLDIFSKKVLVIVPGLEESKYLFGKLRNLKRDNLEIYQIDNNIGKTKFIKYSRKEKITVLIMEAKNIIPLPYDDIEIIYDSYMYTNNSGKINYFYKEHLNLLKTYLNQGQINLMVTEEFFNNSPNLGVPIMSFKETYKYYLKILRNNILEPDLIFTDIVGEDRLIRLKKTLKNLNILNNKSILIDEELLFSIPLNLRPALLIYKIIEDKNKLPLFPFIVLASIIEKVRYINDGIKNDDPLVFYLHKWLVFSREFKNLVIEKDKLKTWCKNNQLNFYNFEGIIEKVIEVYKVLSLKYNIEIAIFNIDNLMKKSLKFLEKAFKEYIYHIKHKEEDNHIYTNNQEEVKIKRYLEYKYPEKIISFYQNRNNNDQLDEIVFYTILEN